MYRRHQTLVDLLQYRAEQQPTQTAYTFLRDGEVEEASITYQTLDQQARTIAAHLQSRGQAGDRVLLLFQPGLDYIAAYFACLYAGMIAVPAYPPHPKRPLARLEAIINNAEPKFCLTQQKLWQKINPRLSQIPAMTQMIALPTDTLGPMPVDGWRSPHMSAGTTAFLQYTSGSTGTPKGVMVSHGNLLHNQQVLADTCCHTAETIFVGWLPLFHDLGLIGNVLQPLYLGIPCTLMAPVAFLQKPIRWLQAISDYGATTSGAPNFGYELCLQKITPAQCTNLDLSRWQVAFNGAEPVRAETLERFSNTFAPYGFRPQTFHPGYGLAEATLVVSSGLNTELPILYSVDKTALAQNQIVPESGPEAQALVSCGYSWIGQRIVIVQPETLTRCPDLQVGEIWVSGSSVTQGYWQQPQETERTFHAYVADTGEGPFLRTGDLGFLKEGELFVTGRLKDLIIIRGQNHYPQDIELTVEQCHPALQPGGGAAFSIEVDGAERLVVVQEIKRSEVRKFKADEVFDHIRRTVFETHDLQVYTIALLKPATIPKTSSGKIQRRDCRESLLNETLSVLNLNTLSAQPSASATDRQQESISSPTTTDTVEQWLIDWLSRKLGVGPQTISPKKALADYGLDSLMAVELAQALAERFDWQDSDLDSTLAWNYPTLRALAGYLAKGPHRLAEPNTLPSSPQVSRRDKNPAPQTLNEPIAVVGMACRLPGRIDSPTAFWQLLIDGVDTVTEIPAARWAVDAFYDPDPEAPGKMYTRYGSFLDNVDRFDTHFFGIAPREAIGMDPQQRLLLEVSWEALEHAALSPERLRGSQTGVFMGLCSDDYAKLSLNSGDPATIDAYNSLGNAHSVAAGRLSYVLGLQGPTMQVDTACSSSLLAVHLACQSLRTGECDLALAGGVNLILAPESTIGLCKMKALSPDGRSKSFDAAADGYGRGEGCGVVVLKRYAQALADGDNILALIRGSAVNHDGQSNGLTAPNGKAQEKVIHQALTQANVQPTDIDYVETHGTGTVLGDPIEVLALNAVLGQKRNTPLLIGSVKTNIGHLEGAAGIAGLLKTILLLHHGQVPGNLHLDTPNPHIPWDQINLQAPTKLTPWPNNQAPRLAGVSSFGLSGTNVHVIVESVPNEAGEAATYPLKSDARPHQLLTLSAKTETALRALASRYEHYLANQPQVDIADICFTANTGRSHFEHRLALIAQTNEQLRHQLHTFGTSQPSQDGSSGQIHPLHRPKVAFLFTGQGSQYVDMGRKLYETQSTFRQTLDRCAQILDAYLDIPLLHLLFSNPQKHNLQSPIPNPQSPVSNLQSLISQTLYTQPALFALEYALAELWQSWGVRPDFVMGHSLGEYVAACVAGVFSLEDGLKLVTARGRLMQALPQNGSMVAVIADERRLAEIIAPYSDTISIAALNAPQNSVLSGEQQTMQVVIEHLTTAGIKTTPLTVSHAFHSPLMEPVLTEFEQIAAEISYSPPHIGLISNVTGRRVSSEVYDSTYWVNHIRQTVRFAQGMETLAQAGVDTFIEVGAKPTLLALGQQSLANTSALDTQPLTRKKLWLPSLRQGKDDWQQILTSLSQIYVQGLDIEWHNVAPNSETEGHHSRRRITLPTYPFERQRYWVSTSQSRLSHQAMPVSAVIEAIQQGDSAQLVALLTQMDDFSAEETRLLPKLLERLTHYHQRSLSKQAEDWTQWLYQIVWQPQPRWGLPPDYLPPIEHLSSRKTALAVDGLEQVDMATYLTVLAHLEAISLDYVVQMLYESELPFQATTLWNFEKITEQLAVIPQYHRLLSRLLAMLVEENILEPCADDHTWRLLRIPERPQPQAQIETFKERYGTVAEAELTLLARCGQKLAEVLSGQQDPLHLLFPGGDMQTVAQIYQESPAAMVLNQLVQQAVLAAVDTLPAHRGIRILEVGAGTGGATAWLLPHLPARQTDYVFTDVSPHFVNNAKEKFSSYDFITYQTLNLEQPPVEQGFKPGYFDLVIAANVLHATRDVRVSLDHIRQLLAPGGWLIMLEGTTPRRKLDLTFGLTEGWWRFTDTRRDYPLLTEDAWQEVLGESEFQTTTIVADPTHLAARLGQSVIVAQASESSPPQQDRWLLLADETGLGATLAAELRQIGDQPFLVYGGDQFQQHDTQTFTIRPEQPEDYRRLLSNIPVVEQIIYLWGLDAPSNHNLTIANLDEAQQRVCGGLLNLVQSLLKMPERMHTSNMPLLWVITRDAQVVSSGGVKGSPSLAQSPLWGLSRVIALEHPEIRGGVIDLSTANASQQQTEATAVLAEAKNPNPESQIVLRNGQRFVARLVSASPEQVSIPPKLTLESEATYLITGGLGALGLHLAQWLVNKGAKHLILTNRQGLTTPIQRQTIAHLETQGVVVHIAAVDVADEKAMVDLFDSKIKADLPLRGVIHAAGISGGYQIIEKIEPADLQTVMRAKVTGTWLLHQLTQEMPLDFFVNFSSGAAVWGGKGQGHYAAANHFLDGLAHYRQSLGLSGLSVNWGAWASGTMVSPEMQARFDQIGLTPFSAEQALLALEYLILTSAAQMTVARIDWSRFREVYEARAKQPLLAEIENNRLSKSQLPSPQTAPFLQELQRARAEDRQTLLQTYLQDKVAGVVGLSEDRLPEPWQDFAELGMDSLMLLDLKKRLELGLNMDLPATIGFEYSTIQKLSRHLLEEFLPEQIELSEQKISRVPIEVVLRTDTLLPSFAQQRFWFLDQITGSKATYIMSAAFELRGSLNIAALSWSLNQLVQRHEALRTTFQNSGDTLHAVILSDALFSLSIIDLQHLPAEAKSREMERLARKEANTPFDLSRDLMLRVKLLRLGPAEHVLLLTIHHIAADGWSLGILARELKHGYQAAIERQPISLPHLPIQYADFAQWQRRQDFSADLNYWQQQLRSPLPVLQLPTDYRRPAIQDQRGASLTYLLPVELSQALKTFSQQAGVTLFMPLLAAFSLLLYRYTEQEDIVIGTPIAGRNRTEVEHVIGLFLNTLALRTDLSGDPTFRELLGRVQKVTLEAYAHQDIPFEQIVEYLQPERSLSHAPIFDAFINFISIPKYDITLPDISTSRLDLIEPEAKFAVSLYIEEGHGTLQLSLVYQTALFAAERMTCFMDQFCYLLQQVVTNPEQPITAYSLITPEVQALLPDPQIPLPEPDYELVTKLFLDWVKISPDQPAIYQKDRVWSYAQLAEQAINLAQILQTHGVTKGDVVAIDGPRSFGLIASLWGSLLSGGVFLTLDANHPPQRQHMMLQEAKVKILLNLHPLPSPWSKQSIQIIDVDAGTGRAKAEQATEEFDCPKLTGDDTAYIFFTSGTTGIPKGVLGQHKGLSHFIRWQRETFAVEPTDRIAQLMAPAFDPFLRDIFLPLTSGATLYLPDEIELLAPEQLLTWLDQQHITILHTVPTQAQNWLANRPPHATLSTLRWAFFAGEPLTETLVQQWRTAFPRSGEIVNLYGPTETTMAKCYYHVPKPALPGTQPVGRPLPETQLFVMKNGRLCGISEPGEIIVRTPFRTLGYFNAAQTGFAPNPFHQDAADQIYHSGDLGRYRLDRTGQVVLEILGRLDDQIKIRGVRIEPAEIKTVLDRHAAVKSSAVSVQKTEQNLELIAYIVPNQAQPLDANELRRYLAQWLPGAMIPSRFIFLSTLPLTANGKLDRRALPIPTDEPNTTYAPPRTPTEEILASIWQEVLELDRVGRHDNFFEIGGHSLLATRVIARIRQICRVDLPLRSLFEYPTLATLAEAVTQAKKITLSPIKPIPRDQRLPLSFAQQRLWVVDQLEGPQATYNMPAMLKLSGSLNIAALARSLNEIVQRHEILRTTYQAEGGEARQIIYPKAELKLPLIDLAHVPSHVQTSELQRLAEAEARRPFDLSHDLMLRANLLFLDHNEYVLLVTIHHIAADAWSIGVLIREITTLYEAYAQGKPSPLPTPKLQYADYAYWQRQQFDQEKLATHLSYWKQKLRHAPRLNLPTDYPRPTVRAAYGAIKRFTWPASLATALNTLGRQNDSTLFMVLLTAFKILLSYHSQQNDIVVGTGVANRHHPDLEELVGFFVNQLVLRTDIGGNLEFQETLQRVRDVTLEAYTHQELPFDVLVGHLEHDQDLSRTPLFQAGLIFHNLKEATFSLPDLTLSLMEVDVEIAKFDLLVTLAESKQGLQGYIQYDAHLFRETTIAMLVEQYEQVLHKVVNQPDIRLEFLHSALAQMDQLQNQRHKNALKAIGLRKLKTIVKK
ncbi:MAG: amino acid adenylation domain-containing protein [Anaerolineae bacterium]|nr:amino acid adenylation domain-containing protein [Anaerolineae bacterium]